MSRRVRPHQPGSAFHLTTRLHGGEALFTPELRTAVVDIIREQTAVSDAILLAYVVMPNHVHLVVRQGEMPLYRFMQPILRRAALVVQRSCGRVGHVFERRYRHSACADPAYLRNAIIYTHINPVRAALCAKPEEYLWSTHTAWINSADQPVCRNDLSAARYGLPLFAASGSQTRAQLIQDYERAIAWRLEADRYDRDIEQGRNGRMYPVPPDFTIGDTNWMLHMTPREAGTHLTVASPKLPVVLTPGRADLSTILRDVISEEGRRLHHELVRSRLGGNEYVRARHSVIRRAISAGYTGVQIASYLRISPKTVSGVLSGDRRLLQRPA